MQETVASQAWLLKEREIHVSDDTVGRGVHKQKCREMQGLHLLLDEAWRMPAIINPVTGTPRRSMALHQATHRDLALQSVRVLLVTRCVRERSAYSLRAVARIREYAQQHLAHSSCDVQ
ncbi:hypothetical protein NDU88_005197 [Pleurodeles waltl]|uniref:Uncharacterized protein n=1 Tax=Pleurodeles waltl TaxID=8319 RepID=A0AAV7W758_PLEWA|nr:hypothetical protein NDU88_005197 [Pleurodeles waltl]